MSQERPTYANNSQTVVVDADSFEFETLEETNGHATVVRFRVENPDVRPGDVLLVLSASPQTGAARSSPPPSNKLLAVG